MVLLIALVRVCYIVSQFASVDGLFLTQVAKVLTTRYCSILMQYSYIVLFEDGRFSLMQMISLIHSTGFES